MSMLTKIKRFFRTPEETKMYYPEISLEEFKTCNLSLNDLFEVLIDSKGNLMLRAKTKLYIASEDDINIISKKDVTVVSGDALGLGSGYISFNPILKRDRA